MCRTEIFMYLANKSSLISTKKIKMFERIDWRLYKCCEENNNGAKS